MIGHRAEIDSQDPIPQLQESYVISFRALAPSVEYNKGFRKPSTGWPAEMRRSFSSETTLGRARAVDGDRELPPNDREVGARGGDVGEASAGGVE